MMARSVSSSRSSLFVETSSMAERNQGRVTMLEPQPGFVAVSMTSEFSTVDLTSLAARAGVMTSRVDRVGSVQLVSWGLPATQDAAAVILGNVARCADRDLSPVQVASSIAGS